MYTYNCSLKQFCQPTCMIGLLFCSIWVCHRSEFVCSTIPSFMQYSCHLSWSSLALVEFANCFLETCSIPKGSLWKTLLNFASIYMYMYIYIHVYMVVKEAQISHPWRIQVEHAFISDDQTRNVTIDMNPLANKSRRFDAKLMMYTPWVRGSGSEASKSWNCFEAVPLFVYGYDMLLFVFPLDLNWWILFSCRIDISFWKLINSTFLPDYYCTV